MANEDTAPAVASYLDGLERLEATGGEVRTRVERVRAIVRGEAPGAVEGPAYGLIGWKLRGKPLLYVGGFARHVGLYATPQGHEAFAAELAAYKQGKGSVQLPLTEELPEDLIRRIVAFRAAAIEAAAGG
jgi:uncharacterized protein YdhG (YjbR/CyaY superfamily)